MAPSTRWARSWSQFRSRSGDELRRSTKWVRSRRRLPVAEPPATGVALEKVGNGVIEVRLLGGERRNVLGRSTISRIEQIVADPPSGTRVIVITAEPPDFCAGYDLVEAGRGGAETLIAHAGNFATLRTSRVPIVMALQGNVIGGGLELALLADVRVATPETRFAIPASKLGLIYSEAGARLVVDAFGESVSRAMFIGGRVVNAEAALAMGVVTEIVSRERLRERAFELATLIASWSSVATSGNRLLLDVIAERIDVDTDALHMSSFAPKGTLATTISEFVARRHSSGGATR